MSLSASQSEGGGGSGSCGWCGSGSLCTNSRWESSISWYQLTKKCTLSLILYLLPWIQYQNEVFNIGLWFMSLKQLNLIIYLLSWHFTLICTPNSTLFNMALYKTCQKCSETNIQYNFFVFGPFLLKVCIFWKEIWQRIQIFHCFAVGGNAL